MPQNYNQVFNEDIEKKLLIKTPKQEDHELTPATRLLERRREMLDVERGLQKQKEDFNMKMESLSQRREELGRKEIQLKASLLKFDKFLQENDAKRLRAIKKAIEERKSKDLKEAEIIDLKEFVDFNLKSRLDPIRGSCRKKSDKESRLKKVRVSGLTAFLHLDLAFHSYLESLLENNSEYVEVKDITSRFDTLAATNAELLERSQTAQEKIEQDRQAFAISSEEKNTMILNCNNQIAKLQTKLEEKKASSAKWQSELDNLLKNASQKSLFLGQVKIHLNNRLNPTTETLAQLDKVSQFIVDLNQIIDLHCK